MEIILHLLTSIQNFFSDKEQPEYNTVWIVPILYSMGILPHRIPDLGNHPLCNNEAALTLHSSQPSFYALPQPLDFMQIDPPGLFSPLKLLTALLGDSEIHVRRADDSTWPNVVHFLPTAVGIES
jgi:hypothetical protein